MHRYWKRFLVNRTGLILGDRALDICCGTGDITQLIDKAVGKTGTAIGLDFSKGMLSIASARNALSKASFIQGDASLIPIKSNNLDTVTVGYGLRNLEDISQCIKEVHRVLRPGGRFLSLDMGKVNLPIIKHIFKFYFFSVVPKIGKLIFPGEDMFDYFPESYANYLSQEGLSAILTGQGFVDVRFYNFYFGSTAIHYAVKK
jgi:demethylmenaquinone methyltransferase/2-methoxy-6-polyprenyl-1,4-benzoquinol methylase